MKYLSTKKKPVLGYGVGYVFAFNDPISQKTIQRWVVHNFYLMIVGIITIFTAYIALKKNKLKWNYFVGIWALVKYNPIGLALISFILSDFIGNSSGSIIIAFIIIGLVFIVAVSSFILGIIIIVKAAKYFKSQNELNMIKKNIN